MEPTGVGTRSAAPSSLPCSWGRTSPIARRAAAGRDDGERGGPHASQVGGALAAGVGEVVEGLVGGVGVDGGHEAPLDAEAVVEDLGEGGEAVRGARRVRDDGLGGGVKDVVVDAHADGGVGVGGGGGDDDPLSAALEVGGRLVPVGEQPRRLDDDVDAVRAPGDLGWVEDLELLDLLAVDGEPGVGGLDVLAEGATHRVVLEEEGHGGAVPHRVVHRDQLDAGVGAPGEQRPVEGASDAAEAVDADAHGHAGTPWSGRDSSRCTSAGASLAGSWTSPDRPATASAWGWTPQRRTRASSTGRAPSVS